MSVEFAGGPLAALMPAPGRGVVMAAYFGHLLGFAGAAATTRGLVLLEGGEVPSGGFTLCDGEPSLGILCGESAAAPRGIDPDLLQLCRALKDLPILLAAGRLLKELGGEHLHRAINAWLRERSHAGTAAGDDGERSARPTEGPAAEARNLQRLYVRARRSSRVYAWTTLHDLRAGLRALLRPAKEPAWRIRSPVTCFVSRMTSAAVAGLASRAASLESHKGGGKVRPRQFRHEDCLSSATYC